MSRVLTACCAAMISIGVSGCTDGGVRTGIASGAQADAAPGGPGPGGPSAGDSGGGDASTGGSGAAGGVALDGDYRTDAARIVNGAGADVVIRGVNWFGFETAAGMPHGLWSRNLGEMLDQVADLGFNTIRLPFSASLLDGDRIPEGLSAEANPDLVGLSSLELMDAVVEQAGRRGLAVILDRHTLAPDNRAPLWYDDTYPQERLAQDWTAIAERYADAPNVLGADLYNEPHDTACWGCGDPARDWRQASEEAADAVLAQAPGWLVFVEGVEQADGAECNDPATSGCNWWGGDLSAAGQKPVTPEVEDKVVYSPHEYATSVFTQPWFEDPDFPENLPGIWDRNWGYLAQEDTAPVMVGEFGSTLEAEQDVEWMKALVAYLDEHEIGFTYWSLNPNSGDTGGILQDDWTTPDDKKLELLRDVLPGPFAPVG
jgi:endoglucanase